MCLQSEWFVRDWLHTTYYYILLDPTRSYCILLYPTILLYIKGAEKYLWLAPIRMVHVGTDLRSWGCTLYDPATCSICYILHTLMSAPCRC